MSAQVKPLPLDAAAGQVVPSDLERIPEIYRSQREYRWTAAASGAERRIAMLRDLQKAITKNKSGLEAALMADLRKNPAEVELTEYQPVISEIVHTIKHVRRWMKPMRVKTPMTLIGTSSEIRYEPKGVVLVIAPWNYPFSLIINPLVAALAAGNCVMLKPSEKTPATSALVAKIIRSVFDEREVAVIEGAVDEAKALLDLPFDHIFFTGSPQIGKVVMTAAAKHLTSVTLELGGKSPVIVDESADVTLAAKRIMWGKFINAGQTCVAPDYLYVHKAVAGQFLDAAKAAIGTYYGETGESRKKSPDFCRLVDEARAAHVSSLVDDAVTRGASVVLGGERDVNDRFVGPTLLTGVTPDSAIMREEIFGPVLPIFTYSSLDEPIEHIQAGAKPLALYVFSQNGRSIDQILDRTSAGGSVINNVVIHLANPNLPFGGTGESGMGNYHGFFGFRAFSHERAILRQGRLDGFSKLFPPYTERVRKMLKWISGLIGG